MAQKFLFQIGNFQGREWQHEMTYLVLFGEVRSLLRTPDIAERQDQLYVIH